MGGGTLGRGKLKEEWFPLWESPHSREISWRCKREVQGYQECTQPKLQVAGRRE